jgi:hypothetical protein
MSNAIESGGTQLFKDKERERMKLLQKKRQQERRKHQKSKSHLRPLFNSNNGVPAVGSYEVAQKEDLKNAVAMGKQVSREAPMSGVFDGAYYIEKKGKSTPGPADFNTNAEALLSHTTPTHNNGHSFCRATRKEKVTDSGTEFTTAMSASSLSTGLGKFSVQSRTTPDFGTLQGVDYAAHQAMEVSHVALYAPPPKQNWDSPTGVKMKGPADPRTKLKTDFCRPPREFYKTGVAKDMVTGGSGSPSAAARNMGGRSTMQTTY